MVEIYSENGLKCPHCSYLDRDTFDIFSELEETIDDYECPHCGKSYRAEKKVSFTYIGTVTKP